MSDVKLEIIKSSNNFGLRNFIVFLVFFCFCSHLFSQNKVTITGLVKDADNNPVAYIDVLLKKNDSIILAFAITNEFGEYKIAHHMEVTDVIIETSSLSHEIYSKPLKINQNDKKIRYDIVLNERVEPLKEIEIKAVTRIQIKNDTTVFNIGKLTDGSEKVVEDVLRKLPGLTLEQNGRLKFKGKDVSNVLLEGDNLFDGNYTIGTKNINAKHIIGVEAIENFEDNPMLQGLTQNEQVALNLKFQDDLSLSGTATLGYGYKDQYYTNGTAIAIAKRIKGFSVISYNNVGNRRFDDQFNTVDFINHTGNKNNSLATQNLISDENNLSHASNSVKNNELFGSFNILPKLSKKEVLRLNVDLLSDQAIERNKSITLINPDTLNNPIEIEQSYMKKINPFYYNSKIMYRKFINAKSSFFTQSTFSKNQNNNELSGTRNDIVQGEKVLFKEHFISNNTRFSHRINNGSAYKIETILAFNEKPENLILISGINFDTNNVVSDTDNEQKAYSRKHSLALNGNFYKRFDNENKINSSLNINYYQNTLSSDLFGIDKTSIYKNDVNYSIFAPELSIDYLIKFKRLEIRPKISSQLYIYDYRDRLQNKIINDDLFLFNSSLSFNFEFDKKHSISSTINHINNPPNEKYFYSNFILRTNRVIQKNELNFNKLISNYFALNYRFNDLFSDTNASFGYSYKKNNNAYLELNIVNKDILFVTNFFQFNDSEERRLNIFLERYINGLRSNLQLKATHTSSNYYNIVNSSNLRYNKNQILNLNFSVGTSYIGKFLFSNTLSYNYIKFKSDNFQEFKNKNITNNLKITYIPKNRYRFEINFNHFIPDISNAENSILKMNTYLNYENRKKTIVYALHGKNLLNQPDIYFIDNTDFSTTENLQSIFRRYFLFSIRFNF